MLRWCLVGLFLLSGVAQAASLNQTRPEIVEGTLDLTDWDLESGGSVQLRGQWLFGWEQSLPDEFEWRDLQARLA